MSWQHRHYGIQLTHGRSFVAETLKTVGRDMKGRDVDEDDVEEHVSAELTTMCLR